MPEQFAQPCLRLGGRWIGRVAEVHGGLDVVGHDVARDAAGDRRNRDHLAEDEAVDLDVADRQVGDRRERLDRRVDRVVPEPRARAVGRASAHGDAAR